MQFDLIISFCRSTVHFRDCEQAMFSKRCICSTKKKHFVDRRGKKRHQKRKKKKKTNQWCGLMMPLHSVCFIFLSTLASWKTSMDRLFHQTRNAVCAHVKPLHLLVPPPIGIVEIGSDRIGTYETAMPFVLIEGDVFRWRILFMQSTMRLTCSFKWRSFWAPPLARRSCHR